MEKNTITSDQAGFRQHRSTDDQVTYIAQKIDDGFHDNQNTLRVWIDMEKAYNRVWKDWLLLKLKKKWCNGMYVPVDLPVGSPSA